MQEVQVVTEELQVSQGDVQVLQVVSTKVVPSGQPPMQLFKYRLYPLTQVVQVFTVPVQVLHGDTHALQTLFRSTHFPSDGQLDVHALL